MKGEFQHAMLNEIVAWWLRQMLGLVPERWRQRDAGPATALVLAWNEAGDSAELWHRRIREELDIAGADSPDLTRLFKQEYQGSRYSFGYPACPRLEDQEKLFELLNPSLIDVNLTEEFQLEPEQSTSAIIVHHPEAKYFAIE